MTYDSKIVAETDEPIKYSIVFSAKYLFKCLDVLFKIVGWFLLIMALRVLSTQIDSQVLRLFALGVHGVYFLSLTLFGVFLLMSSRKELGLPHDRVGIMLAIIVKIVGILVMIVLINPSFPLDHIGDRFIELKTSK